jgi:hypothetical protein
MSLYSPTWEMVHESALYIPDMALLNTHTLYLLVNVKSMTIPDFQMSVIKELCKNIEKKNDSIQGWKIFKK